MRPSPLLACIASLVLFAACGGDAPDRKAKPSQSVDLGSPSAKPTVKPTVKPSPSPSPSPTGPPPVTGDPLTSAGAYLRLARGEQVVTACDEAYPELLDVSCDDMTFTAGGLLWVAGTRDAGGGERQWVLRLHTFVPASAGYVLRYEAVDPEGTWRGFRLLPAKLTGFGIDSLVVQVIIDSSDGQRGYDLLTWRKGGPLTLRAHRAQVSQLRVAVGDLVLDEYFTTTPGGQYSHRRIRWDGARFRAANLGAVAPNRVPPPS